MKIKALTGIETSRLVLAEDERGDPIVRNEPIILKEGEIADIDDKVAQRLLGFGHASEDLTAETVNDRLRREAATPK